MDSLGQLDISKQESVGYNAGLAKPRSGGLARTTSTASSVSSSSSSEAGDDAPATPAAAGDAPPGSAAQVSDGLVQKKPPSGLLQSVAGKISQTVTSAKDAIVGKSSSNPTVLTGQDAAAATTGEGQAAVPVSEKVGQQAQGAKEVLSSAGAAIASSAVAAKDAVVGAVSPPASAAHTGPDADVATGASETDAEAAAAAPQDGVAAKATGILQTARTKIASSAQYVKDALVTSKPAAADSHGEGAGEAASPTGTGATGKGILAKVKDNVTQSAQYIKQTVQAKAVTDPADPEKVDVKETAKAALEAAKQKVSEGSAYVRDKALTKGGPYSQSPLEPPPETGLVNPTTASTTTVPTSEPTASEQPVAAATHQASQ